MKALRIFAKIPLFSLSLLLTIFVAVSMLVIERFAGIINILSGIIVLNK